VFIEAARTFELSELPRFDCEPRPVVESLFLLAGHLPLLALFVRQRGGRYVLDVPHGHAVAVSP
jgi:hypothetical protein